MHAPRARLRPSVCLLSSWLLLLLIGGCPGDDPVVEDGSPVVDTLPDGGPPPVAPEREPEVVAVTEWMVGWIPNTMSSDPVYAALVDGSFTYPASGWDANKINWSSRTPGASGGLGSFPAGTSYAATKVTLEAPAHLFIRCGPTYSVWINGTFRPGDVYGSRSIWVPLPAQKGENLIVVQVAGGRGDLQVELWTTPDELVLNPKDVTQPDLLVGDGSEQCLGVPVLNLTDAPVHDLVARVVGSGELEQTTLGLPALAPRTLTQLTFAIKPKQPFTKAEQEVKARLHLESPSLAFAYEREVTLTTVGADTQYRRSRISGVDGSCQYYGVTPPSSLDAKKKYALVLSLHGAGVEAINQAKSYSQKDWTYVVAATNRRRFGFDWEVWGRLDAIETLDHATSALNIDPTRVYLVGHSMGGHGTWHVGVMHPGRFAVLGPSAGWSSFYSYGGATKPSGFFARTQAHSDTNTYLSNLARRGVYILHGGADTNVPTSEGQAMYQEVQKHTSDVKYHEEPGADHWWDGDKSPGVDCVDWPDLFDFIKAHTLDPHELDFDFRAPAPWVNPTHSYVTILSQTDPYQDSLLSSKASGTTVILTTTNVRGLTLDGAALKAKGVTEVVVDGKSVAVTDKPIPVGEQSGKQPGVYGPFNEAMYRPFCLVYPDGAAGERYREHAAHLLSTWAVIGNGQACAMSLSRLKQSPPADRNLIYLGVAPADIDQATLPFSWDDSAIKVGSKSYQNAALALTFVRQGRLAAAVVATKGAEQLLLRIQLFTSRLVLPDYMVWDGSGVRTGGFFDAQWKYDPTLQR